MPRKLKRADGGCCCKTAMWEKETDICSKGGTQTSDLAAREELPGCPTLLCP